MQHNQSMPAALRIMKCSETNQSAEPQAARLRPCCHSIKPNDFALAVGRLMRYGLRDGDGVSIDDPCAICRSVLTNAKTGTDFHELSVRRVRNMPTFGDDRHE